MKRANLHAVSAGAATMTAQKYIKLSTLATELHVGYDRVYGFVRRYNKHQPNHPIKLFRLPTQGGLHISTEDGEMIRSIFLNPEDYAEQV